MGYLCTRNQMYNLYFKKMERRIKQNLWSIVVFTLLLSTQHHAAAQSLNVDISGAEFLRPLVEQWIENYKAVHAGFEASITIDGKTASDIKLDVTAEKGGGEVVGRYYMLPIAHAGSTLLSHKSLRHGVNRRVARELFVEHDLLEEVDADTKHKTLPATFFYLTGKHAIPSQLLAHDLGVETSSLKGKRVLGRPENVITAILRTPDGLAYSIGSLAYDTKGRTLRKGLTVIPTDLDGDGKVSDDESHAIADLDALTTYLSLLPEVSIPIGQFYMAHTENGKEFADWIMHNGQNVLTQQGYLKAPPSVIAQK